MMNPEELLTTFGHAIQHRVSAEEALRIASSGLGTDPVESQQRSALTDLLQSRDAQLEQLQGQYEETYRDVAGHFDERLHAEEAEHQSTLRNVEANAVNALSALEKQRTDSTWVVESVLDDSADDSPTRIFERFKNQLHKTREEQSAICEELGRSVSEEIGEQSPQRGGEFDPGPPPVDREAAAMLFNQAVADVRKSLKELKSLILARLVRGTTSLITLAIFAAIIGAGFFFLASPERMGVPGGRTEAAWIMLSAGVGVVAGLLLTLIIYTLASMKQAEIQRRLREFQAEMNWGHHHWLRFAKEELARQQKSFDLQSRRIQRDRSQVMDRFDLAHRTEVEEIESDRQSLTHIEHRRHAEAHASLTSGRRQQLADLEQLHQQTLQQLTHEWTRQIEEAQTALEAYVRQTRRAQQEQWNELKVNWDRSWKELEAGLQQLTEADRQQFAEWKTLAAENWSPAEQIPSEIRLGQFELGLHHWEGAVSEDVRLAPRVTQLRIPYSLPFPEAASVLFKSKQPAARDVAIRGLQCLMLRLLTLIPPGKLRFTIIDPVGLGESFGGFMHLTDYDEMLVTNRIWTEANHIEARLADLTEHMENVLQKYLRNEFQTIEEYNESAGEVAEPYHVLVISDFPAKFSEIAARRLISIVNSGPRCGVYTLMNCDPARQMPNNFSLAEIQAKMSQLEWNDGAFHIPNSPLSPWPLKLDEPPAPDAFTSIVKMVGEASKDSRRVEVAFSRIIPTNENIWKGDSRSELVIPLGRAGATKLQQMRLGKGTSQHMLVAGKTGSGKSTFMHILITNLALHYSPDEVNFILIDFKKGVEFKDYATRQLPHARIIAVESDREFGVSALQKLGDILQERGELFRREGVQDIAGYRNSTGKPLPRVLLVVDEFQEFFVEDDKISQTAALLLDRLVRQGRAFGIHVILGSQTLGGAYSLARSTLGQVAVRVALQCSEADAHLILSEENSAARLLTRPGEAIYNDANGMLEGNHPFQIAWINEGERETALDEMHLRLKREKWTLEPTIVFEGNIPSDLTRNPYVDRLIHEYPTRTDVQSGTVSASATAPSFWLGDAVEIAPATAITLHRQSGTNVLIVGQDADAALGVMAAAFISLAAATSPDQELNSLYVLDGSHAGSDSARVWEDLVKTLPVDGRLIGPGEATPLLEAMTAERQRRESEGHAQSPPIVLLVYNVARFRDLRKPDDDFGMGSFGSSAEKKPDSRKQFADLLSQGPAVGIHIIVWCDSFNNLDRWFSRQSLREFEYRIAFQMNASDSSNFVDSPAASRLGTHRALLHREETGASEKFRPYGLPPFSWMEAVRRIMLNEARALPSAIAPEHPDKNSADDDFEIPDLEEFSIQ